MDLLLVNPIAKKRVYQSLSESFSAVEPPFWAALTAGFIRSHGFSVGILDANALNLSVPKTAEMIAKKDPSFVNVVVYGQHPSASTQLMNSVGTLCHIIKRLNPSVKIVLSGLHPSALPIHTMLDVDCDYVAIGEGFYTLLDLLSGKKVVRGLVYRKKVKGVRDCVFSNGRTGNVEDLTSVLSDVAWDLLPWGSYRAHNHQCLGDFGVRDRYASLSTSLGCPFRCSFCAIHATFGEHRIRYWSPSWVLGQIDVLVNEYGVRVLKVIDEMFVFNPKHFVPICDGLIDRGYDLNIWAYARVDTVKQKYLDKLRRAGFRWLCLGIESANINVQNIASKLIKKDMKDVVRMIQDAGIYVLGNYVFGFPGDDKVGMQGTLDFAMDLNTEFANFYSSMCWPGSDLYNEVKKEDLPESWLGYSQHSYECKPLPTDSLSSAEILRFRDDAFQKYFSNSKYLDMVENKFGLEAKKHIMDMTCVKLRRKILEKD